ncbi:MAG: VapC toxin family PIN domain ribonuclease [Nitrospirae bacterium]|nr:MAG: VapC toxin family PIN domain ribonuclease [Nitrospirota bacterium]
MIVADTNLIASLYVEGQRTLEAEAVLQKDPMWAVPLLWRSEFRNTLVGLLRKKELDYEEAMEILGHAEQWLKDLEFGVVSSAVMQLARDSGCSAYDCEFVSLAHNLETWLITNDRQLLQAFPQATKSPKACVETTP